MFAAQCLVYEVSSGSISSTVERILWKCIDPEQTSEFTVMYTLNIKDQCNAADELLHIPQRIDCMMCNRMLLNSASGEYSYYLDLSGLHPFSTYAYSVQPRTPNSTGSALGGDQFTTETAGEYHATSVKMQN